MKFFSDQKRLRTLRHPHILHVIESFEIKTGVKGKSFIITEKAVPISHIINNLSTTHLKLGIYQILVRKINQKLAFI